MIKRKNSHHGPTSFIKKTYRIINDEKFNSIISWNEDGASFIINDLHLFANTVLPQYFKHKNFASFVRQLNMYDFHKLKENSLEFTHPLFQRNNYNLLKEIRRKNNEIVINKDNVSELSDRIQKFQRQQSQMENLLESLSKEYEDIVHQNQLLVEELIKSKQREKNIEGLLTNFKSDEIKSLQKLNAVYNSSDEDCDYEKLSPI